MIYDGVLAQLLGIDLAQMEQALGKQLGKKAKALALNLAALQAGFDFADANLDEAGPVRVEPMNETAGQDPHRGQRRRRDRLHDGRRHGRRLVSDHAVVVAVRVADRPTCGSTAWTRQTGKATFAIVQAEDEIARARHGDRRRLGWARAR